MSDRDAVDSSGQAGGGPASELKSADWVLRSYAYEHIIATGAAPTPAEAAASLERGIDEVEAGLRRLHEHHQVVLAPGGADLWMLHPFSAVPTEFPVALSAESSGDPNRDDGVWYWANCAWDAFGIPAVLGADTRCATRCAESGEPIELEIRDGEAVATDALIHFVVPARHWYDNVAFT